MWALYPESSQRTLEEIDLLFAAKSPWVWTAEANFRSLLAQNPQLGASGRQDNAEEVEKGLEVETEHEETV